MSFTLTAEPRERVGSRHSRALRASSRIPCNIQGHGGANQNFSIGEHQFLTARRHHEHLFEIDLAGEQQTALVRELQWDAFGDHIVHVEFRRVIRGEETEAEVELEFVGRTTEGFLNHLLTHITIAAIPSKLPDLIEVDISHLHVGTFISVGELPLPEDVRLVTPPETHVANLTVGRGVVIETAVDEDVDEAEAVPTEAPAAEEGDG